MSFVSVVPFMSWTFIRLWKRSLLPSAIIFRYHLSAGSSLLRVWDWHQFPLLVWWSRSASASAALCVHTECKHDCLDNFGWVQKRQPRSNAQYAALVKTGSRCGYCLRFSVLGAKQIRFNIVSVMEEDAEGNHLEAENHCNRELVLDSSARWKRKITLSAWKPGRWRGKVESLKQEKQFTQGCLLSGMPTLTSA